MTIETKLVRRSFDRRRFLRGLGSAALVMPPLLRARAAAAATRKNVVIFYVGGGLEDANWYQSGRTSGALTDRPLTGTLSLFDAKYPALRNKLTVVEGAYGLWQKFPDGSDLFAHDRSTQCALNCTNPDDPEQEISLDRRFAAHLQSAGQDVPFGSLMLCASRGWKYNGRGDISRGGSAALSTMFTDPLKTYERVFMGVTGGPVAGGPNPETARALEKGILSASLEQCEAIKKQAQSQMGAQAARQVSDQCDALRDMEKRLLTMAPAGAGVCTVPEKPTGAFGTAPTFHQTLDAFRRLGANALACARTNVVLVEVWRDQPDETARFQAAEFQNLIIHLWHFHKNNGGGDQNLAKRARVDLDNRTVDEFAKWAAALDGLGLLDDGLALWATNEPRGDHSVRGPLPCMFAGSLGGKLRTGAYHRIAEPMSYGNATVVPSINEVYAALLRAAGLPVERHGPQKYHRTGSLVPNKLLV